MPVALLLVPEELAVGELAPVKLGEDSECLLRKTVREHHVRTFWVADDDGAVALTACSTDLLDEALEPQPASVSEGLPSIGAGGAGRPTEELQSDPRQRRQDVDRVGEIKCAETHVGSAYLRSHASAPKQLFERLNLLRRRLALDYDVERIGEGITLLLHCVIV